MKKLYFMRHGLSEMNVAGIWSGTTETPLTDTGRKQARHAGETAGSLGIDIIVCSTLSRAIETAEIVASKIGYPLDKIQKSDLLIERHFGGMEGQPYFPDLDMENFAGVESIEALFERARLALEWIQSLPGDTILIVSHGSTGRALRHIVTPAIPFQGAGHLPNAEIILLS
jgi:broad specificity phosphatase PhoE